MRQLTIRALEDDLEVVLRRTAREHRTSLSRLMRGDPDVSNLVRRSERVLMSVVVVGELLFGLPGVEIGDSPP